MAASDIGTQIGNAIGTAAAKADPITALASVVSTVIDRLLPDKNAQAQAKLQIFQMQLDGELQQAMAQMKTNQAEASSQSVFVAGWRPFIGWICGTGLGYDFLFRPVANGIAAIWHPQALFQPLDLSTLLPLLLGMLGLAASRTIEKLQGAPGAQNLQ